MNLEELRAAYEAATEELHRRREAMESAQRAIDEADENADVDALRTAFDEATTAFDEQIEEAERCKANLADAERRQRAIDQNPRPVRDALAARPNGTSREPLVYSPQSQFSFFADAYRMQSLMDWTARERLERHGRQNVEAMRRSAERAWQRELRQYERLGIDVEALREMGLDIGGGFQFRDVGTGAFAGLTVPQYLIDLYAPLARAGAPLLTALRKLPLPASGMTLNVSIITTGTAAAAQASENAAVQETDADDTLLTVNIRTYAGQQDVSRQALERSELVDVVVFQDLIADYFTKLDAACLNADGTSGTHLGIKNTGSVIAKSYTDASPTVPELYPKVADAIQSIGSTIFRPATTVLMHPRRWGWGTAALDSNNRPLFLPNAQGPFNALAVGDAPDYGAVVGSMQGLPVITDANIVTNNGAGTNEDQIFVVRMPELLFFQEGDGDPRQFRFEEAAAPQSIRLAVWGYSAFTAGRYPGASSVISGTGLVTPTF